jgi:hypothetical protein
MKVKNLNPTAKTVKQQLDSIRNSMGTEQKELQLLFENMISGCVYTRVIFDEKGIPINYVPLAVNKTFEKIIGKNAEEIVGQLITDVHPGMEKDEVDYIKVYGNVAVTGDKFEAKGKRRRSSSIRLMKKSASSRIVLKRIIFTFKRRSNYHTISNRSWVKATNSGMCSTRSNKLPQQIRLS